MIVIYIYGTAHAPVYTQTCSVHMFFAWAITVWWKMLAGIYIGEFAYLDLFEGEKFGKWPTNKTWILSIFWKFEGENLGN